MGRDLHLKECGKLVSTSIYLRMALGPMIGHEFIVSLNTFENVVFNEILRGTGLDCNIFHLCIENGSKA